MTIPKNLKLLDAKYFKKETLTWFSNGYYNFAPMDTPKTIQYLDLSYPKLNPKDIYTSMFRFELKKDKNRWDMARFSGNRPSKQDLQEF